MTPHLLHLCPLADWTAARAAGVLAPPSLHEVGFVHLSTPEQVALPADRLFHARADVVLLAIDAAALDRAGIVVAWEPGRPDDPPGMVFPHAYGPVPGAAVTAVLHYRPRPDGGFDPPPDLPGSGWSDP